MEIGASITVDPRLNGPARSANGGVAAGLLGSRIEGTASVRLYMPPPLGVPMDVVGTRDGLEARHEGQVAMKASPGVLDVYPPEVSWDEAVAATAPFVGHVAVTCVVCGPDHPGGFHLSPGPIGAGPVNATTWTPPSWAAGEGDVIRRELVWGALDCPGAIMLARHYPEERFFPALGTITARIDQDLVVGGDYAVVAWPRGRDGKKLYAGTAIFDRDGSLCALSDQVCIAMPFEWASIG